MPDRVEVDDDLGVRGHGHDPLSRVGAPVRLSARCGPACGRAARHGGRGESGRRPRPGSRPRRAARRRPLAASNGSRPAASSAPTRPASTSPAPAVASHGDAGGVDPRPGRPGRRRRVRRPLSSTTASYRSAAARACSQRARPRPRSRSTPSIRASSPACGVSTAGPPRRPVDGAQRVGVDDDRDAVAPATGAAPRPRRRRRPEPTTHAWTRPSPATVSGMRGQHVVGGAPVVADHPGQPAARPGDREHGGARVARGAGADPDHAAGVLVRAAVRRGQQRRDVRRLQRLDDASAAVGQARGRCRRGGPRPRPAPPGRPGGATLCVPNVTVSVGPHVRAVELAGVGVDAGRQVDRDDRHPVEPRQRRDGLVAQPGPPADADDPVDHDVRAARASSIATTRPPAAVERRQPRRMRLPGREQHRLDRGAPPGQHRAGVQRVAAVVAGTRPAAAPWRRTRARAGRARRTPARAPPAASARPPAAPPAAPPPPLAPAPPCAPAACPQANRSCRASGRRAWRGWRTADRPGSWRAAAQPPSGRPGGASRSTVRLAPWRVTRRASMARRQLAGSGSTCDRARNEVVARRLGRAAHACSSTSGELARTSAEWLCRRSTPARAACRRA